MKNGYCGKESYNEGIKLIKKQNPIKLSDYGSFNYNGNHYYVSEEARKLDNNNIINYIKSLKEDIYTSIRDEIENEKKNKQDAINRAKAIKGLTREYFDNLLSKKDLLGEERQLFILKICKLFEAILSYDYHCEGKDFYGKMTSYFNNLMEAIPQSRFIDDDMKDYEYEEEVVIPEREKIEHLVDLFNRLRIQRNNFTHPESIKVNELTNSELEECLNYVFSISKEEAKDE